MLDNQHNNSNIPLYEEEINLVDVAVTVIKHIKIAAFVFVILICVCSALIYKKDVRYEMISLFELGITDSETPIQGLDTLLLQLNNQIIPEIILKSNNSNTHKLENLNITALKTGMVVKGPEVPIIRLHSITTQANLKNLQNIHYEVLKPLLDDHNAQLKKQQSFFEQQINLVSTDITALESKGFFNSLSNLYEYRSELSLKLNNIKYSNIILGQLSNKAIGASKSTLLAIATIISFIISLLIILIIEFSLKVKQKINS